MVGVVLLCYTAVMNLGGMVVVALFFGFFSGIFIGLPPVIFVVLTKDKTKIGTRIGMGFAIVAFGVLAGGPGGGAILGDNSHNLHWKDVWTYGGVMTIGAAALFTILRFWRGGMKLKVKV
jgi:MFS family permease